MNIDIAEWIKLRLNRVDVFHNAEKTLLVKYIKEYPDMFKLCNGCNKIIYHNYIFCPYCKSYNFGLIDFEKLSKDSSMIDYITWEF